MMETVLLLPAFHRTETFGKVLPGIQNDFATRDELKISQCGMKVVDETVFVFDGFKRFALVYGGWLTHTSLRT